MKKVFFNTLMVAGISGMMVGCADDIENLYDPDFTTAKQEYQSQWKKQFGTIDPQQTWGFGNASQAQAVVTRWANTSANQWGGDVEVPAPLTDEQKAMVTAWFEANPNPQSISVNWSDFFAQQVSSNEYGKNSMSYLCAGENDDHMNNFNGGDCGINNQIWYGELSNPNDQNSKVYGSDKIQFMQGSSTSRFGYQCTLEDGGGSHMYYNYVIVPGERIDASLAGMYFLGYDFESNGTTADKVVAADGYYQDWIIKVTPAIYKNASRIICEDLGTSDDFDFNDVVFDASIQGDQAVITVRAAGGTLPVYIGGVEVHEALGVAVNKMANTGANNGVSASVAIFRVDAPSTYNLNDIDIVVNNASAQYVLTAEQGEAPQKICVPTSFKWCSERVSIKDAYADFAAWTQDASSNTEWYNSPAEGTVVE